jgi:hypothetical protein
MGVPGGTLADYVRSLHGARDRLRNKLVLNDMLVDLSVWHATVNSMFGNLFLKARRVLASYDKLSLILRFNMAVDLWACTYGYNVVMRAFGPERGRLLLHTLCVPYHYGVEASAEERVRARSIVLGLLMDKIKEASRSPGSFMEEVAPGVPDRSPLTIQMLRTVVAPGSSEKVVVVTGEPGSGKTTSCLYSLYAVLRAAGFTEEDARQALGNLMVHRLERLVEMLELIGKTYIPVLVVDEGFVVASKYMFNMNKKMRMIAVRIGEVVRISRHSVGMFVFISQGKNDLLKPVRDASTLDVVADPIVLSEATTRLAKFSDMIDDQRRKYYERLPEPFRSDAGSSIKQLLSEAGNVTVTLWYGFKPLASVVSRSRNPSTFYATIHPPMLLPQPLYDSIIANKVQHLSSIAEELRRAGEEQGGEVGEDGSELGQMEGLEA